MTQYTHPIDRSTMQELFVHRLNRLGFDEYGFFDKKAFEQSKLGRKNPALVAFMESCLKEERYTDELGTDTVIVFRAGALDSPLLSIRPYYWGDNDAVSELPNFETNITDIKIQWYKYALRAATSNVALTPTRINRLFDEIERQIMTVARETMVMAS